MSVILSVIALFLFFIVGIIYMFFLLLYKTKKIKWYKYVNAEAYSFAYNVDVLGNYLFANFWNWLLSKGSYKFGVFGETMSGCLGKKQQEKSLSITGWILLIIINFIDFTKWFKGGHCVAQIQDEFQISNFIKQ